MAIDPAAPRSRRAILAAAVGGAGALAVQSLSRATPVAAADGDNLVLGQSGPTQNDATSATIVFSDAAPAFGTQGSGTIGIHGVVTTTGTGVQGSSATGTGVVGVTTGPGTGRSAGVVGATAAGANLADNIDETGVYGHADDSASSAGVWGDSPQGIGVVGTGDWAIYGFGPNAGSVSVIGDAPAAATGVYGFAGNEELVVPTPGAGVVGRAGAGANYGIVAAAGASSAYALYVAGRLRVSGSAGGRTSFSSTATSKKITLAGVTTGTLIVATLQTSISGCYVRAVVPAAGSFTIYLSKAPGKTAVVGYLIAN